MIKFFRRLFKIHRKLTPEEQVEVDNVIREALDEMMRDAIKSAQTSVGTNMVYEDGDIIYIHANNNDTRH